MTIDDKGATKYDAEKPDLSLLQLFSESLNAIGKLAEFGARKYSRGGFLKVPDGYRRYTAALIRHWLKEPTEIKDPETGLEHDIAVAWNAMARLELRLREQKEALIVPEGYMDW